MSTALKVVAVNDRFRTEALVNLFSVFETRSSLGRVLCY